MGVETLLILAAAGVAAGGEVYSGIQAKKEAASAAAMEEYNARVAEQEAKQIEKRSEYEQQRQTKEAARTMGTLAAGLSASGAIPSEGTPLLLQAKQASELELENLMIGYEGKVGAGRAMSQATLDRMQAKLYRQKGRNLAIGSYMKAGSTLLTGFEKSGMFNK